MCNQKISKCFIIVDTVTKRFLPRVSYWGIVLIGFSLTVKAATLKFNSGRGSAISSAKQGESGSIYNLVKNK